MERELSSAAARHAARPGAAPPRAYPRTPFAGARAGCQARQRGAPACRAPAEPHGRRAARSIDRCTRG